MSSSRALVSASLIAASSAASSLPCSRIEFEDRPAAVLELAQIGEARLQRAQLRVVERAGRLLAVAGDEGHGRTLVQKPDRGGDLAGLDVQLLGDAFGDGFHGSRISSVGRAPLVGAPAPAGQSRSPSLATATPRGLRGADMAGSGVCRGVVTVKSTASPLSSACIAGSWAKAARWQEARRSPPRRRIASRPR